MAWAQLKKRFKKKKILTIMITLFLCVMAWAQLKGKVDALTKELQSANESWDTKWNEENWAKQVPKS